MENNKLEFTDKIDILVSYQGYLWLSDSKEPIVFDGVAAMNVHKDFDEIKNITDTHNPFIVEGQLYSEKQQLSYSIKYVDGKHLVTEYELKNLPAKYDEKDFIPHQIDGASKIRFRQYWRPEKDDLCEGMDVLCPAEYVFVGFKN